MQTAKIHLLNDDGIEISEGARRLATSIANTARQRIAPLAYPAVQPAVKRGAMAAINRTLDELRQLKAELRRKN